MRHIISLALLIACTLSWVQSSAQSIVIDDCIQDSFVLCAPNPAFSLPDNNQLIVGVGAPGATSCTGHVRLPLHVTDTCGIIIRYVVDLIPFDGNDTVRLQDTSDVILDFNDEATLVLDSKLFGTSPINLNGIDYNEACRNEPGGFHRLLWTVMDGCGDLVVCDFLLRMEDCISPAVDAVGLSSIVMPSTMEVTLVANDFIVSVVDDCSPENWILHSFDSLIFTPTKTFNCAAIDENGSNAFVQPLWSADAGVDRDCDGTVSWNERNLTRSNTLIVFDLNVQCEPEEPFGRILSENQVPIEGVEVSIFDIDTAGILTVLYTDADGIYGGMFINPLLDLVISPAKGGDDSIGVSTLDLIKIQKHLLGLETFNSPFKYIAADANNTESVSAADLLELRKLILRINHQHPNNESWRFVPTSFVFNDLHDPWPFDETIMLTDNNNNDFVAVKIGDINGSVTQAQMRSTRDPISLEIKNQKISGNETIEIDFTSDNFQDVIGFQFTLQMAGLDLLDIFPGKINITLDQFATHKDAITCSWFDLGSISAKKSEVLFTLVVRARTAGMLGDILNINSRLTKAESYIKEGSVEKVSDIIIHVRDISENNPVFVSNQNCAFALFQNEPNPFKSETTIPFSISESGKVSLRVFDALGREMYFSSRDFPAGRNAFRVNFSSVEEHGLLYYAVSKCGMTEVRKMLINAH